MAMICLYALLNGINGLLGDGNPVDPTQVLVYSLVTGVVCIVVWAYESRVARGSTPGSCATTRASG
jgi:predicted Co/Zn/Cd cation transporter (cation efflux family)